MKKIVTILFCIICFCSVTAQELDCRISVLHSSIQGTNIKVFETLQNSLNEFMNNRKWTNHVYENEERIECNILINLEKQEVDLFEGTIQIQARRPVFNSTYYSTLLNHLDNDLQFQYIEYQPLEFGENTFISNITSIMAYYAYIIIGLDYDSFSLYGGTEFFQKAEAIVTNAQNVSYKGWKAFESSTHKNRYWLTESLLSDKYKPLREFSYKYHRMGLDRMADKPNEARAEIAENLKLLQNVFREKPDQFMPFLKTILNAKSEEIISIFSESFPDEKNRVIMILIEIDAPNASKYEEMKKK